VPRLVRADAETLVLRHFGVAGTAVELGGERTQNFRIRVPDGAGFALKVSAPGEDAGDVALENAALRHIERNAPEIVVPRVVSALDGGSSVYLGPHDGRHLRLLSYLPGTPLATTGAPSASLRRAIGGAVAHLDAALKGFDHPLSSQRDLIWDVKNIARIKPFFDLIDPAHRPLAERMLQRFETMAAPHLAEVPMQAVHSDMNGQNILVDPAAGDSTVAFLDFGDLVHAPRIVDLAGAALLPLGRSAGDLDAVADVVAAYHRATPLGQREIDLLPEFMIARCVMNVAVTEWLAHRAPANRAYIMKNNPTSWMCLERLDLLPHDAFRGVLTPLGEGSPA
jgi:Ser/Thr protein kinase RdoA (MazF antagonist)